jgi:hypothetical protein
VLAARPLPLALLVGMFAGAVAHAQGAPRPDQPESDPERQAAPDQLAGSEMPAQLELPQGLPPLVPPELIHFEEVAYPAGLDLGRVEIQLTLLIDEQGGVEELIGADGSEPFASLAAWAATRLRFQPALELGQPVAVELPFTYVFERPPVNLRGALHVHGTRSPAVGVEVAVGDRLALTDDQGRFELRNVAPGSYTARCTDPDVHLDPFAFQLEPGTELELDLWAQVEWDEGELMGTYHRRRSQALSRSLSAQEVATTPGTMGDPVRAVQNLPGVARSPLDAGWLLVRGGDPEDTGLYLDGIRVPLVYHVMGLTSVLPAAMVDRVDFHPGGYDVRYGRAIGGVVDLRTEPVQGQGLEAQAAVDLISSSAYLRSPVGKERKTGVAMGVRRSYLDGIIGGMAKRGMMGLGEGSEDIAPRYWDWQLRVDRERVGLFALGYDDLLHAPQDAAGGDVVLHVGTRRLHGRWETRLAGKPLEVTPVMGFDWHRLSYPGYDDGRTKAVYGARAELVDDGNEAVGWSAGVDWETGRYQVEVETDEHPAGVDVDAGIASVDPYADLRIGLDRSLTLGMRVENLWVMDQLVRAMPSPRASGRLPLGESIAVVGTAGVYHQWPPLDLVVALPQGPYLRLERAYGGSLGLQASWARLSLESTGYGRALQDITLVEDDGSIGQGRGVAYGVESMARGELGDLAGWVSYTWGRALRQEEPGHLWEAHRWDQPHNLVTVLAWDLPGGWVLASRFRISSGFPIEEDIEHAYDVLILDQRCIADPSLTGRYSSCPDTGGRLPNNHSLDFKISRTWSLRSWSVEGYLDIQNVYNRRNPEPVITGSIDIGTLYAFGFPILPVFGVKGIYRRQ